MSIRILHDNLHQTKTAGDLIVQLQLDTKDLLIISEQCRNEGGAGWYALGTAAIWIPNVNRFVVDHHGSERGYEWVKWDTITYVSRHFTPNTPIVDILAKLERLEDKLRETEEPVIVTGNVNKRAV